MNGFRYNLFDGLTDHFTLKEQTDYLNIYNPNFVESLILLYCYLKINATQPDVQFRVQKCFRYNGKCLRYTEDVDVVHDLPSVFCGTLRMKLHEVRCSMYHGLVYMHLRFQSHRQMPMRLKAQVYKTMVRPVILYGAETWAVKEEHVKKLEVAEMKCLRAIRGVTTRERMRNEDIRQKVQN